MSENRIKENMEHGFKEFDIPAYMQGAIERYIMKGVIPGDFLVGVISNDLKKAVWHSDSTNSKLLRNYVMFFYNNAPSECWGSLNKIVLWSKNDGSQQYLI